MELILEVPVEKKVTTIEWMGHTWTTVLVFLHVILREHALIVYLQF